MPYLLTPGPLTTSRSVKATMLADWGSRDVEFRKVVADIRKGLLAMAGCDASYECVIMQGSGTFAIEAALGCFCPAGAGKTLVVANGAYGDRAAKILERIGRPVSKIDKGDSAAPTVGGGGRRPRCRSRHHPCLDDPLRDHLRHRQSDPGHGASGQGRDSASSWSTPCRPSARCRST